jgi:2-oxo-4-hydroxy-4-carboxy--5-ureidoimidazoline (OHCU) decarboxylase
MGIFKNFMLKQMLKSKMKGVPEAEQEMILELVEKHPDFFKKIGDEVEKRKKSGQDEMAATMQVMREHQSELQKLMMK